MTIGSLFSGIGGLELGLERAGFGPVIWQVETDPFRRSVLARHWPQAERFEDVRGVGSSTLAPVDLICGGFPCRDVSSAGKRAGLAGPQSGLWYEFARIAEEMRPRWIVVENVASGSGAWVDQVRGDLERLGYASLPVPVTASDCGALHRRARVFIVAHADRDGEPTFALDAEVASTSAPSWAGGRFAEPPMVRVVNGFRRGLDHSRRRALGDSVVPQQAQVVGHVIRELLASGERAA